MTRIVEALQAKGPLAAPIRWAVDVLDVVQSMATYNGFVRGCGWSPAQYKAWAYRTLIQLLPPVGPARERKLDAAATHGFSLHECLTIADGTESTAERSST